MSKESGESDTPRTDTLMAGAKPAVLNPSVEAERREITSMIGLRDLSSPGIKAVVVNGHTWRRDDSTLAIYPQPQRAEYDGNPNVEARECRKCNRLWGEHGQGDLCPST
jgi:hypothetical protein